MTGNNQANKKKPKQTPTHTHNQANKTQTPTAVFPREYLIGVINIVGAMPFSDFSNSMEGLEFANRITLSLPSNIAAFLMYAMAKYRIIEGQPLNENMTNNMIDRQIMLKYPENSIKYATTMKQAFNKDRIIGVRDDLRLMVSSKYWGDFKLKHICNEYNNKQQIFVYSIYGLNDTNVPPTHGQFVDNYFENLKLEFKKQGKGNILYTKQSLYAHTKKSTQTKKINAHIQCTCKHIQRKAKNTKRTNVRSSFICEKQIKKSFFFDDVKVLELWQTYKRNTFKNTQKNLSCEIFSRTN